jgi:divalent metal cation (Fe/Co/Zn/Cd) transporter
VFVEFQLEVDGDLSVQEGHGIVDSAEHAIAALFPKDAEVIGHLEPARVTGQRLNSRAV